MAPFDCLVKFPLRKGTCNERICIISVKSQVGDSMNEELSEWFIRDEQHLKVLMNGYVEQ